MRFLRATHPNVITCCEGHRLGGLSLMLPDLKKLEKCYRWRGLGSKNMGCVYFGSTKVFSVTSCRQFGHFTGSESR